MANGTYAAVANLLWTGTWDPRARMTAGRIPSAVMSALRALPRTSKPMDALRTAVSVWGATQLLDWPPTEVQARALTEFSPSALAAFARIREDLEPIDADPTLDLVSGFLYQLTGKRPDKATARALDAYFIVGAEHGLNASTFTARIITSTRSDIASAVAGAIGAMTGPLHGGAPSEVVEQIHKVGPEHAERGSGRPRPRERLMGFGHRVYRAYDPRAAALRKVRRPCPPAHWLELAIGWRTPPGTSERNTPIAAQDERGVLRGGGPPGRRPDPGPLPGHVRARPPRGLDGPRPRAGLGQPPDPARRALRRRRGARPPEVGDRPASAAAVPGGADP